MPFQRIGSFIQGPTGSTVKSSKTIGGATRSPVGSQAPAQIPDMQPVPPPMPRVSNPEFSPEGVNMKEVKRTMDVKAPQRVSKLSKAPKKLF